MNRRMFLAGAGLALSTSLGGCLQDNGDPGNNGTENRTDDENGPDNGGNDTDEMSIDGRLHNAADESHTFEIVIHDADGEVLTEGARDVEANSTTRIPAVGRPGETRTFDASVKESQASELLEFDVEPTPEEIDGYVDITYGQDGNIEIAFTPRDEIDDEGDQTLDSRYRSV